jgi:nicotinate phosphoribosyltransferase
MVTWIIGPEIAERYGLDVERIRRGFYTDQYFNNVRQALDAMAAEGYRYAGSSPPSELVGHDLSQAVVGGLETDMQIFTRREPFSIVAGTECALAATAACTGYFGETGKFVNTADRLAVWAVREGTRIKPWLPAMRIAGRYRDFGILETVVLGFLTRMSLIATNVYEFLCATRGKPVFFFPARFDLYHTQMFDGLAYKIGVGAYNRDHGASAPVLISTDAQGALLGQRGTGTMSHSYLLCFLKDTAEATVHFARVLPREVKRVALVDVNNDCVGDSVRTARAMFEHYRRAIEAGQPDEAEKFVLFGVRTDTSGELRDVSIEPLGDARLDCGVCPRQVWRMREALDALGDDPTIGPEWRERAREYFRNIKIVVSGGFTAERAALFTRLGVPADLYGVGSWFFRGGNNDFTADVVRVKVGGVWHDLAKEGRRALENPDLEEVMLKE